MAADGESRWGVASLQRRRHPRLNVSLPVEFVLRETGGAEAAAEGPSPLDPRRVALRNVGGGGLLLVLPRPITVGTGLSLTLYLPDEGPPGSGGAEGRRPAHAVRAEAVVVWVDLTTEGVPDECRCGIAFTAIGDADRAVILEFIARARTA